MRFNQQIMAAVVGIGLMSGAARAAGVFTVTGAKSATVQLDSIAEAQQLISGSIAHSSLVTNTASVVNFNDPNNAGGKWHFANKAAFNIDTAGVDNYFAIKATGTLVIPTAGNYTFGVNSDDGFSLTVGSHTMSATGLKSSSDSLSTFNFPQAGNFALTLYYFQAYGEAQVELFASPGSFTTFGAAGSNFQLINNAPTSGALQLASAVPEPASLAVIGIGATMLLKRRRAA